MSDFRYPHRIAALRERLTTGPDPLDALIVSHLDNCRYLSGFTGSNALVIISPTKAVFLTDGRYTLQASIEVTGFEQVILPQGTDLAKAAADQLRQWGAKNAAYEETNLTVKAYNALRAAVDGENGSGKDIALIGKTGLVESVRAIKDTDELSRIRKAVVLADRCFEYALGLIKPGLTERELAWKMEVFMRENGALRQAFDSIIGAGPNSALIHGKPSDRPIGASGEAEFLLMDFGAELEGYCSDMTRTVVVGGEPTARHKEMYEAVLRTQLLTTEALKPGVKGRDVQQLAVDTLTAAGLGEYFAHGLGHQIGRVVHDGPAFSVVSEAVMLPGMAVTIEPGAYIANFGGARIEDIVVITENGHEVLTQSPKELIVIK